MLDEPPSGNTRNNGEIEITIRNRRTGEIKHKETISIEEYSKWQ